jgi:hypothetical protein
MKFWFFLLLIFNLVLFGFMYVLQVGDTGANAVQELNPEKLPLVGAKPIAVAAAKNESAIKESDGKDSKTTISPVKEPIAAIAQTKPPAKPEQCLQWGNIKNEDLPRARVALAALQLGDKLSESKNEDVLRYWVYIPAPETKKQVDVIVATLKKQGVSDVSVLSDNTISLGVFSTEEASTRHLEQMEIKGVRSARSGVRTTQLRDVMFSVREPAPAVASKINELQKEYVGSSVKQATCS